MAIPKGFRCTLYELFPKIQGIATPLRPQARFERNRRFAAALSARCGALVRNDSILNYCFLFSAIQAR